MSVLHPLEIGVSNAAMSAARSRSEASADAAAMSRQRAFQYRMRRIASIVLFMVASMRFTSGWSMIADDSPAGAPGARPCLRTAAYSNACW